MLRHIVLVSFKPEASESQIAAWGDAVRTLCGTSDEVLSFTLGTNVGSGPNHHDAALVADFEDHARHVTAKLAAIQHEM